MVVETRISSTFSRFDVSKTADEAGGSSSVHVRCTVTVAYATRRLRGNGLAVPDRATAPQPPWTSEERRHVEDPSIFLRREDTLRAVQNMLASMPPLREFDLSPGNWETKLGGRTLPQRLALWLQERGSKGLLLGTDGQQRCYRFKVEVRLRVTLVFSEPQAALQRCAEVAMQTVAPGSSSGEECGICLDEFQNGDKSGPVNLPCTHAFHVHCMLAWLDRGSTCPTCRYDLRGMVTAPPWARESFSLPPPPSPLAAPPPPPSPRAARSSRRPAAFSSRRPDRRSSRRRPDPGSYWASLRTDELGLIPAEQLGQPIAETWSRSSRAERDAWRLLGRAERVV